MAGCLVSATDLHAARSRTGTPARCAGRAVPAPLVSSLPFFLPLSSFLLSLSFFLPSFLAWALGAAEGAAVSAHRPLGSATAPPTHMPPTRHAIRLQAVREPSMSVHPQGGWRPALRAGPFL